MRNKQGTVKDSSNGLDSPCENTRAAPHDDKHLNDEGGWTAEPAEYSDEFAKMILEAAAGEFEEMEIDTFLAELHCQIAELQEEEQNRQSNEGAN